MGTGSSQDHWAVGDDPRKAKPGKGEVPVGGGEDVPGSTLDAPPAPAGQHEAPVNDGSREPQPGEKLGKYLLVSEIGKGGMGRVFLARARRGEYVAVKTVKDRRERLIHRLEREGQLGMALHHHNIIQLLDADLTARWPYIVFELLDGRVASKLPRFGRPLPALQVMLLASEVAQALRHATKIGVIHRDVKPGNIFLTFDGRVKLLDLGLAWARGVAPLTHQGDVLGTVSYMAPEQLQQRRDLDVRADVYSLGATCFRLLTGRLPWPKGNVTTVLHAMATSPVPQVRQYEPRIPTAVNAIVTKMMAIERKHRYADYDSLIQELERFLRFQTELTQFPEDRAFLLRQLHMTEAGFNDGRIISSDDLPGPSHA